MFMHGGLPQCYAAYASTCKHYRFSCLQKIQSFYKFRWNFNWFKLLILDAQTR